MKRLMFLAATRPRMPAISPRYMHFAMCTVALGACVKSHRDNDAGGTLIMALRQDLLGEKGWFHFDSVGLKVRMSAGVYIYYLSKFIHHHQTATPRFINLGSYLNVSLVQSALRSSWRRQPAPCGRCCVEIGWLKQHATSHCCDVCAVCGTGG